MGRRLDETALDDEGVREVLDLCLECRACKSECPVSVDVARFKSEFLAGYWSRHAMPARVRLFGYLHELSRLGSPFAALLNPLIESRMTRLFQERIFGIDRRRALPRLASQSLASTWKKRRTSPGEPQALLFNDTFTNFYSPEIGLAAAEVLERAGILVGLAFNGCCGRPLISQGLLAEATDRATDNVRRLYSAAEAGRPILFLEPSCLSAQREDVPALLRGEDQRKARDVARVCFLFEDFLQEASRDGRAQLRLRERPGAIVLHGHCHQKSMGLVGPARALLERIPGATVIDLDAGCCGMAGAFGYAPEHFDVSRAIAERRLLPAARTLPSGGVLVASGVSCRQQVRDLAGVHAVHPAELLHSLVAEHGS
jgi:Fe-S oxidoreductase